MANSSEKIKVNVKLIQITNRTRKRMKSFVYGRIKKGTYHIIIAEGCNSDGIWCLVYTISEQVINVIKSKLQRWSSVVPFRDITCFHIASKSSHVLEELKEVFEVEIKPTEVHAR